MCLFCVSCEKESFESFGFQYRSRVGVVVTSALMSRRRRVLSLRSAGVVAILRSISCTDRGLLLKIDGIRQHVDKKIFGNSAVLKINSNRRQVIPKI